MRDVDRIVTGERTPRGRTRPCALLGLALLALAGCRAGSVGDGVNADAAAAPTDAATIDAAAIDAPPAVDAAVDAAPDAPRLPDVAYAPPQPLPPGMCAPRLPGDWTGVTHYEFGACSSCSIGHDATITWHLASTDGCVDRYVPSGTVHKDAADSCNDLFDDTTTIEPTDGALIVDRSTVPPTYEMTGETRWIARWDNCMDPGPPSPVNVSVVWAAFRGEIVGDVFGGGNRPNLDEMWWRFTRTGAQPVTPAPCVEPPVDFWVGRVTRRATMSADVVWRRISTLGCSDLFEAVGTVRQTPGPIPGCTHAVATPDHAPILAGDGRLHVNRSRWPPEIDLRGRTVWDAQVQCTRLDGTVVTLPQAGGDWADRIVAPYTGDRAAGEITSATAFGHTSESWALAKVP